MLRHKAATISWKKPPPPPPGGGGVDLQPACDTGEKLDFEGGAHWNPRGHAIVEEALAGTGLYRPALPSSLRAPNLAKGGTFDHTNNALRVVVTPRYCSKYKPS